MATYLSPVFKVLIDGQMSEAEQQSVILEDVDDMTFVRFGQFAYTGDYSAYSPVHDHSGLSVIDNTSSRQIDAEDLQSGEIPWTDSSNIDVDSGILEDPGLEGISKDDTSETRIPDRLDEADEPDATPKHLFRKKHRKGDRQGGFDFGSTIKNAVSEPSKRESLCEEFRVTYRDWTGPSFRPYRNCNPTEEMTEVFLCHAYLYVFADRYQIESLSDLTLYKLRRTLAAFKLFPERAADFFKLVHYSYANTREGDNLRDLMVAFAGCYLEHIAPHPAWRPLLCETESFAGDVLAKIIVRLY